MASPTLNEGSVDAEEEESLAPQPGPITLQANYRHYLEENHVPQMFESLIASLMLERPTDMLSYLDTQLEAIKNVGLDNIDWETFIYKLHPSRDPLRKELVKDEEFKEKQKGERRTVTRQVTPKLAAKEKEAEKPYEPTVFKLTEPAEDDEDLAS